MAEHEFEAQLWRWDEALDGWFFVTVPAEASDGIRVASGPPRGFGSVRVEVTVGSTTWRTSVFPDKKSGCFVLPVKQAVRRAEGLDAGDPVAVALDVVE
ncbi:DUF1905 domain-containing protein [Nocardioides gansuensis]|nr:DUF1905 domain-containing protein [Nocardioides gansuensis]